MPDLIHEYDPVVAAEAGLSPGSTVSVCADGSTEGAETDPSGVFWRQESGLLFRDEFDRADGPPGDDWDAIEGNWEIVSNRLQLMNPGSDTNRIYNVALASERQTFYTIIQVRHHVLQGSSTPHLLTLTKVNDALNYLRYRWAVSSIDSFSRHVKVVDGVATNFALHNAPGGTEAIMKVLHFRDASDVLRMTHNTNSLGQTGVGWPAEFQSRAGRFGLGAGHPVNGAGTVSFGFARAMTKSSLTWGNPAAGYRLEFVRDGHPAGYYAGHTVTIPSSNPTFDLSTGPIYPYDRVHLQQDQGGSWVTISTWEPLGGFWGGDVIHADPEGVVAPGMTSMQVQVEMQDGSGAAIATFTSSPVQTGGLDSWERLIGPQGMIIPAGTARIVVRGLKDGDGDACIRRVQLNAGTSCCPYTEPDIGTSDPLSVTLYRVTADLCGMAGELKHEIGWQLPSFVDDPNDPRWTVEITIWENGLQRHQETHPANSSPVTIVEAPGTFGHFRNAIDAVDWNYRVRVRLFSFTNPVVSAEASDVEPWGEDCTGVPV